jgi:hypothetical protein
MIQTRVLSFLVGDPAQELPFGTIDPADAQAGLLQHLHGVQLPARLAHFAQLFQENGDGKLLDELDVHHTPFVVLLRG